MRRLSAMPCLSAPPFPLPSAADHEVAAECGVLASVPGFHCTRRTTSLIDPAKLVKAGH